MRLGSYTVRNRLFAAPMAGVTDRAFRTLCRRLGAGVAVSEMIAADPRLRTTRTSALRRDHAGESEPRVIQIAGADPGMLAEAARYDVDHGAQIIDVNMGCPAKKVCNRLSGSALLADEDLVARIVERVAHAVSVPVTVKIRTGPDPTRRNAERIARIAQDAGLAAITVHGRTRACGFRGQAEYDTIRAVKEAVAIPVIANGDVTTPEEAGRVLAHTGADALMIGRAAQGNPWIFREIDHYLETGSRRAPPSTREVRDVLLDHLDALHAHYGEAQGVRVARKHLGWYCRGRPGGEAFWRRVRTVESARAQRHLVRVFLSRLEDARSLEHAA